MRILISGASGFVGSPLSRDLSAKGHEVVSLVRSPTRSPYILWNPEKEEACLADFEGFDAVIHLAGEPLSFGRWTKKKKEKIFSSRVKDTFFLSYLLSRLLSPPKLFLSASAVGFYGDRGEEILDEKSPKGEGFLAEVCDGWEKASRPLEDRGSRVVHARFGIILSPEGGALQKMMAAYRFGLGGRLGSGKQWISWVARDDLIRAIEFILQNEKIEGPVNITSPHPVRQEEFSKVLAEFLHRPHFLHMPAFLLKLLLGEAAQALFLSSARVQPAKLLSAGFVFQYSKTLQEIFE